MDANTDESKFSNQIGQYIGPIYSDEKLVGKATLWPGLDTITLWDVHNEEIYFFSTNSGVPAEVFSFTQDRMTSKGKATKESTGYQIELFSKANLEVILIF